MKKGIILKLLGGFYYVKVENKIYECRARGRFRKNNEKPLVGDYVNIYELEENKGYIVEIIDRKNKLLRPEIANIDNMMIVVSIKNPNPNFVVLNNMIIHSYINNIEPIICLSKIDLDENKQIINEIKENFKGSKIKFIEISKNLDTTIDLLKYEILGKITAFSGNSGVGKSTIISKLTNLNIKTNEISKINRGKHTTRHSELFELDKNTYIFDTPGFSSLSLPNIKAIELKNYFKEFLDYQDECKFMDCLHINEPKCNVIENLQKRLISKQRYEIYKKFIIELKEKEQKY